MRISVGQIVVVTGDMKIGVEIVGAIQQRREAEGYVKSGHLPREVLVSAVAMGGEVIDAEADGFFEGTAEDEEEDLGRGGVKEQRAKAEARRNISARTAMLLGGAAAPHVKPDVEIGADLNVDDI